MSWDGDTVCKQCHQDQIDKKTNPLQIVLQEFPCPIHGHPGWLSPALAAWVEFYNVIAPYSREGALDHVLISKICDEEGLNFLLSFEWLTFIHETLLENQSDENKGLHTGTQENAG